MSIEDAKRNLKALRLAKNVARENSCLTLHVMGVFKMAFVQICNSGGSAKVVKNLLAKCQMSLFTSVGS